MKGMYGAEGMESQRRVKRMVAVITLYLLFK